MLCVFVHHRIAIKDRVNPARVKLSGPGIDPKEGSLRAGKPAKFSADARGAGDAALEVKYAPLSGAAGSRRSAVDQQADVRTHGDGLFDVVYYPQAEGTSVCTAHLLLKRAHSSFSSKL